jgi:hypothetical protein
VNVSTTSWSSEELIFAESSKPMRPTNTARTHLSLDKDAPIHRPIQGVGGITCSKFSVDSITTTPDLISVGTGLDYPGMSDVPYDVDDAKASHTRRGKVTNAKPWPAKTVAAAR